MNVIHLAIFLFFYFPRIHTETCLMNSKDVACHDEAFCDNNRDRGKYGPKFCACKDPMVYGNGIEACDPSNENEMPIMSGLRYEGCFDIPLLVFDLQWSCGDVSETGFTVSEAQKSCARLGFTYTLITEGLIPEGELGHVCFCHNFFDPSWVKVDDSKCDMSCVGDAEDSCDVNNAPYYCCGGIHSSVEYTTCGHACDVRVYSVYNSQLTDIVSLEGEASSNNVEESKVLRGSTALIKPRQLVLANNALQGLMYYTLLPEGSATATDPRREGIFEWRVLETGNIPFLLQTASFKPVSTIVTVSVSEKFSLEGVTIVCPKDLEGEKNATLREFGEPCEATISKGTDIVAYVYFDDGIEEYIRVNDPKQESAGTPVIQYFKNYPPASDPLTSHYLAFPYKMFKSNSTLNYIEVYATAEDSSEDLVTIKVCAGIARKICSSTGKTYCHYSDSCIDSDADCILTYTCDEDEIFYISSSTCCNNQTGICRTVAIEIDVLADEDLQFENGYINVEVQKCLYIEELGAGKYVLFEFLNNFQILPGDFPIFTCDGCRLAINTAAEPGTIKSYKCMRTKKNQHSYEIASLGPMTCSGGHVTTDHMIRAVSTIVSKVFYRRQYPKAGRYLLTFAFYEFCSQDEKYPSGYKCGERYNSFSNIELNVVENVPEYTIQCSDIKYRYFALNVRIFCTVRFVNSITAHEQVTVTFHFGDENTTSGFSLSEYVFSHVFEDRGIKELKIEAENYLMRKVKFETVYIYNPVPSVSDISVEVLDDSSSAISYIHKGQDATILVKFKNSISEAVFPDSLKVEVVINACFLVSDPEHTKKLLNVPYTPNQHWMFTYSFEIARICQIYTVISNEVSKSVIIKEIGVYKPVCKFEIDVKYKQFQEKLEDKFLKDPPLSSSNISGFSLLTEIVFQIVPLDGCERGMNETAEITIKEFINNTEVVAVTKNDITLYGYKFAEKGHYKTEIVISNPFSSQKATCEYKVGSPIEGLKSLSYSIFPPRKIGRVGFETRNNGEKTCVVISCCDCYRTFVILYYLSDWGDNGASCKQFDYFQNLLANCPGVQENDVTVLVFASRSPDAADFPPQIEGIMIVNIYAWNEVSTVDVQKEVAIGNITCNFPLAEIEYGESCGDSYYSPCEIELAYPITLLARPFIVCKSSDENVQSWKYYRINEVYGFPCEFHNESLRLKDETPVPFPASGITTPQVTVTKNNISKLSVGTYRIMYTVKMVATTQNNVSLESKVSLFVRFHLPEIKGVLINGINSTTVGVDQVIRFNPDETSEDPSNPNAEFFNCNWFCRKLPNEDYPINSDTGQLDDSYPPPEPLGLYPPNAGGCDGNGPGRINKDGCSVELRITRSLGLYEILSTFNVRNDSRIGIAKITLNVTTGVPPQLEISCGGGTKCRQLHDGRRKVNYIGVLRLHAKCRDYCPNEMICSWKVYYKLSAGPYEQLDFVQPELQDPKKLSVKMNETLLVEEGIFDYKFIVSCYDKENSVDNRGSAAINLVVNQPPAFGTCTLVYNCLPKGNDSDMNAPKPLNAIDALNYYRFKAENWSDPDQDGITVFRLYLKKPKSENKGRLIYKGARSEALLTLAQGEAKYNFTLNFTCEVGDRFDGYSSHDMEPIQINFPMDINADSECESDSRKKRNEDVPRKSRRLFRRTMRAVISELPNVVDVERLFEVDRDYKYLQMMDASFRTKLLKHYKEQSIRNVTADAINDATIMNNMAEDEVEEMIEFYTLTDAIPMNKSTTCEGEQLRLECPPGSFIKIRNIFFGNRGENETCGHLPVNDFTHPSKFVHLFKDCDCCHYKKLEIYEQCVGNNTCEIEELLADSPEQYMFFKKMEKISKKNRRINREKTLGKSLRKNLCMATTKYMEIEWHCSRNYGSIKLKPNFVAPYVIADTCYNIISKESEDGGSEFFKTFQNWLHIYDDELKVEWNYVTFSKENMIGSQNEDEMKASSLKDFRAKLALLSAQTEDSPFDKSIGHIMAASYYCKEIYLFWYRNYQTRREWRERELYLLRNLVSRVEDGIVESADDIQSLASATSTLLIRAEEVTCCSKLLSTEIFQKLQEKLLTIEDQLPQKEFDSVSQEIENINVAKEQPTKSKAGCGNELQKCYLHFAKYREDFNISDESSLILSPIASTVISATMLSTVGLSTGFGTTEQPEAETVVVNEAAANYVGMCKMGFESGKNKGNDEDESVFVEDNYQVKSKKSDPGAINPSVTLNPIDDDYEAASITFPDNLDKLLKGQITDSTASMSVTTVQTKACVTTGMEGGELINENSNSLSFLVALIDEQGKSTEGKISKTQKIISIDLPSKKNKNEDEEEANPKTSTIIKNGGISRGKDYQFDVTPLEITHDAALFLEIEPLCDYDDFRYEHYFMVCIKYGSEPMTVEECRTGEILLPRDKPTINNCVENCEDMTWRYVKDNLKLQHTKGQYFVGIRHVRKIDPGSAHYFADTCSVNGTYSRCNSDKVMHCPYRLSIYTASCSFSEPTQGINTWKTAGCIVYETSNKDKVKCGCNHMSTFAGSISPLPPTTELSPALFDPRVMYPAYLLVFVLWVVFFILLLYMRRKDKADIEKIGALPLADNDANDSYIYEIQVQTGIKAGAGTSSNVYFILYGDHGNTKTRKLSDEKRKILQRDQKDTFLMTTPQSLGPLSLIRIWHDSSGKAQNQSWYCDQVVVRDIQTGSIFYFLAHKWWSLTDGDGLTDRMIQVATSGERQAFQHLFINKTRDKFDDDHLYFSVFFRPPTSNFTRCQRLVCCLCLLLLEFCASAAYYDRDQQSSSSLSIKLGPINIRLQTFIISFICSLFALPASVLLVQMFRHIGQRPKSLAQREKEERLEGIEIESDDSEVYDEKSRNATPSQATPSSLSKTPTTDDIDDIIQDMFGDGKTSREKQLKNVIYELEMEALRGRGFLLPHWFLSIAWTIAFSVAVFATLFVLYSASVMAAPASGSVEERAEKIRKWVLSMIGSLISSIFLVQPFKIVVLVGFFSFICKPRQSTLEKQERGSQHILSKLGFVELQKDEEYLNESTESFFQRKADIGLAKKVRYLKKVQHARETEKKLFYVLANLAFYILFVSFVFAVIYTERDDESAIYFNHIATFFNPHYTQSNRQLNVTTFRDFFHYMSNRFVPAIYARHWYNGAEPHGMYGFLNDRVNLLVGYSVMRQIRVKPNRCETAKNIDNNHCNTRFSIYDMETKDFCENWDETDVEDPCMLTEFSYTSDVQLHGIPVYGLFHFYPGSGYVVHFDGSEANTLETLEWLANSKWLDTLTRAVFVEFSLYNPNSDLFAVCSILFEFPPATGIVSTFMMTPIKLSMSSSSSFFNLITQVGALIMCALQGLQCLMKLYREKHKFFKDIWNVIDGLIVLSGFAAAGIFVVRFIAASEAIGRVSAYGGRQYINMQYLVLITEIYIYILGGISFVMTLKFLWMLKFNKRVSSFIDTLNNGIKELRDFAVCFGIIFFSFTCLVYIKLHTKLLKYQNVKLTMQALFSILLGKFDFHEIFQADPELGPWIFLLYSTVMVILILNVFVCILNLSIKEVKHLNEKRSNEYEVIDYLLKKINPFKRKRKRKTVVEKPFVPEYSPEELLAKWNLMKFKIRNLLIEEVKEYKYRIDELEEEDFLKQFDDIIEEDELDASLNISGNESALSNSCEIKIVEPCRSNDDKRAEKLQDAKDLREEANVIIDVLDELQTDSESEAEKNNRGRHLFEERDFGIL